MSYWKTDPAVRSDVPMAPMTTYKVGGRASHLLDAVDLETLDRVVAALDTEAEVLVVGRGSNLVVSDEGFPGLVIRLGSGFLGISVSGRGDVDAGGAVPLPKVARTAAAHGRAGLSFFAGIPGSVGGAVKMNAGGHGADTAARLITANVLEVDRRRRTARAAADLDLGYRSSNLGARLVVLGARFRTEPGDRDSLEAEIRSITRWRKENQPGGTLNAGSVFKNPRGDAAGRLIDAAGLKGTSRGSVSVSTLHANFFVAERKATAQDLWDLVWSVRRTVGETTGVWLEPEVTFVGRFRQSPDQDAGPERSR